MNGPGRSPARQRRGKVILASTLNEGVEAREILSRLGVGPGLSQQQLAGAIPFLRLLGVQLGIGRAGPAGLTAADWSDPADVGFGGGLVQVYVTTSGRRGKLRDGLEPVVNPYAGTVAGGHAPLFLAKIGGVWYLVTFGCP